MTCKYFTKLFDFQLHSPFLVIISHPRTVVLAIVFTVQATLKMSDGDDDDDDDEGTEEEMEGDRHPAHVRSPPTYEPWLHLC